MAADPHRISLRDALTMVQRARQQPPKMMKGWSIDGAIIREILEQPGAGTLRAYLAATEEGEATLVYVGVDGDGKDLVNGVIAEFAWPCPPLCDTSSPFNQS